MRSLFGVYFRFSLPRPSCLLTFDFSRLRGDRSIHWRHDESRHQFGHGQQQAGLSASRWAELGLDRRASIRSLVHLASWYPGRPDRLWVDGQSIIYIYNYIDIILCIIIYRYNYIYIYLYNYNIYIYCIIIILKTENIWQSQSTLWISNLKLDV